MEYLVKMLREDNYSCVIRGRTGVRTFTQRGVADLYELYETQPDWLRGATVADKVVGKGAAAIMALAGVKKVYAGVISTPAAGLLRAAGIEVESGCEVPFIRNRQGTGWCPVETLCRDQADPAAMLPLIGSFLRQMHGGAAAPAGNRNPTD